MKKEIQISLLNQIIERLLQDNPKAKIQGEYLRGIKCPQCGKHDAWGYLESPWAIICPHQNHCGAITKIRDVYPVLFENLFKHHPPTQSDPKATARAALHHRGINPQLVPFGQGQYTINKTTFQTLLFTLSNGCKIHRIINPPTKEDRMRFDGTYAGAVWETPEIDYHQEIWITEAIIDSISLYQAGKHSISTLSCHHVPEAFYKRLTSTRFVIGFDGDSAGIAAIAKHQALFDSLGIAYRIAIPPDKLDWNDLLQQRRLNEQTLDDSLWRGRLYQAKSPEDYHTIYSEKYRQHLIGFYVGILEFQGGYFYVGVLTDKKEGKKQPTFTRLSRFTLKLLFSVEDDSVEYESDILHIVEIRENSKKTLVRLTANELTQNTEFKKKLMRSARALWLGSGNTHMNAIAARLLHQKPQIVRKINTLGYDKKSNAYVFGHFLYNSDGNRETLNSLGYFERQQIQGTANETLIQDLRDLPLVDFLQTLHGVYGMKGLLVWGYYNATLFNHVIMKQFRAFPFCSVYGKPDTGKTTLINVLNATCFMDWPGIVASELSTRKSITRQLSSKIALPIPFLESNHKMIGISEGSLLNAYHQGSLQDRAAYTNDNQVNSLPFKGGLVFTQNYEPFTLKAVKQRVVSLEFCPEDCTETSREWMAKLKRYSLPQLASIGHQILGKRQEIEAALPDQILEIIEILQSNGILTDRIQFTHAVLASSFLVLADLFGFQYHSNLLIDELVSLAKKKEESAANESVIGQDFLEAFETLKGNSLEKGTHYIEDESSYYLRLAETLKVMKQQDYAFVHNPYIHEALKKHDRCQRQNFQKNSVDWKLVNKKQKVWEFAK